MLREVLWFVPGQFQTVSAVPLTQTMIVLVQHKAETLSGSHPVWMSSTLGSRPVWMSTFPVTSAKAEKNYLSWCPKGRLGTRPSLWPASSEGLLQQSLPLPFGVFKPSLCTLAPLLWSTHLLNFCVITMHTQKETQLFNHISFLLRLKIAL